MLKSLEEFGFQSLQLGEKDFGKDTIVQLGYEPNRIDLLTQISGVTFNQAFKKRIEGKYGDETANFISLDDLITNKQVTGSKIEVISNY